MHRSPVSSFAQVLFALFLFTASTGFAQVNVRIMAANLTSGNDQSYETEGINIFQGLKPDVVAIQEFQYNNSSSSNSLRTMVNTAFGTNFSFYVEPGYPSIPNGIVSRWPILTNGSWDSDIADRGYAWARIDLPGTNDLYVVSIHLKASDDSAAQRAAEAIVVKSNINLYFPSNAWIVVGGDLNTYSQTEACMTTFKSFLADAPAPADQNGGTNTNAGRTERYDRVMASFSFTNQQVPVVIGVNTFTNGLVFDSRVYSPLSNVAPVTTNDSGAVNMQHMAIVKDFLISTNSGPVTNAPAITTQPTNLTVLPGSNATFTVIATGTAPLAYQWQFSSTNLPGATTNTYTRTNAQTADAGNYRVIITNTAGSVTSSVAVLTVTNAAPAITTQPASVTVTVGDAATFSVLATGTAPLAYQWRFNGTNLAGATATNYSLTNIQLTNAGNYLVVITNAAGSVTSSVAVLTVNTNTSSPGIIAQWNFNSLTPDANTGTGTTSPSVGSGAATLVGGLASQFFGGGGADTTGSDNSAWSPSGYPAATIGNKTAGVQFTVSTVGKQNISVSWSSQISSSGSKYARLQYTTNGTDFTDFTLPATNATSFSTRTNNLTAITSVNNNASFAIRIVTEFESTAIGSANANYVGASGAYATGGTLRYDMVTIYGSTIATSNAPAAAPELIAPAFANNEFSFTVTGTVTTNYAVQACTNLAVTNWISLLTNPVPFTFTQTNATSFPTRFFRAVLP